MFMMFYICKGYCLRLVNGHRILSFYLHTNRVVYKNVALYFCPYLCQLLADFQNHFTGVSLKIMWLLHIPLHCELISTLPCEI